MTQSLEEKTGYDTETLNKVIAEKYNSGMSIAKIAKELGVSSDPISNRLKKMGITIRRDFDNFNRDITKDMLECYYYSCGYTIKELMPLLGCKSDITAARILKKFGIDTNHNKRTAFKNRKDMSEEEFREYLLQEYCFNQRTIASISEEFNVSHTVIARYLKKFEIPKRTKTQQIELKNSKKQRRAVTIKDGYVCLLTDKNKQYYQHRMLVEQELGRTLAKDEVVHHIDGNRQNNSLDNLLLLSNGDHAKLHALLRKGISHENAVKEVNILWAYCA